MYALRLLAVVALVAGASGVAVVHAEHVRDPAGRGTLTFVLAGQSNMRGYGIIDGKTPVDARVVVLTATGWETAREPLPNGLGEQEPSGVGEPGVGPGIALADQALRDGLAGRVQLLSCSRGGSLAARWRAGGKLFRLCADQIARVGHVDGVFFYQGEEDTSSAALADAWSAKFRSFVDGMRRLVPHVPVVFAQLGPNAPVASIPEFRFWSRVKAEQAAIRMRDVTMVRTDDLAVRSDQPMHHTANAERTIGRRFLTAWRRLA